MFAISPIGRSDLCVHHWLIHSHKAASGGAWRGEEDEGARGGHLEFLDRCRFSPIILSVPVTEVGQLLRAREATRRACQESRAQWAPDVERASLRMFIVRGRVPCAEYLCSSVTGTDSVVAAHPKYFKFGWCAES